jgi:hypothetical protein
MAEFRVDTFFGWKVKIKALAQINQSTSICSKRERTSLTSFGKSMLGWGLVGKTWMENLYPRALLHNW